MFEEQLQKSLFSTSTEKSFIDKLLSKEDIQNIKELMVKERLTRGELLELLYMCLSAESKLWNLGEYDRYLILKFFVWIREFIKVAELLYDYKDYLQKQENTCARCKGYLKSKYQGKKVSEDADPCLCIKNRQPRVQITPRTWQHLDNNVRMLEHNAKFIIDLYFNIGRTSLSIGATGFLELLKNKYEVIYPNMQQVQTPQPQQVQMIRPPTGKGK